MKKIVRIAALAAATTLVAAPAVAAPVAASPAAKAKARIIKPLTLTATQDLDFGTIVLGDLSGGPESVAIDQAGAVTCGAGNLTCSGAPQAAEYRVTGTNNLDVTVAASVSNLTNTTSGGSELLAFTPDAPATVNLGNSGVVGKLFNVGGSITIDSATVDGVYQGDMDVTVDY